MPRKKQAGATLQKREVDPVGPKGEFASDPPAEESENSSSEEEMPTTKDILAINVNEQDEVEEREKNRLEIVTEDAGEGVLYIGHIPFGFFEREMKQFFEQFGDVKRLRVSRSKKTGGSKGYAFVQFESADVATIAAKALDGHLLAERKLVCNVVPTEKVHPRMFEGSNRSFKKKNPVLFADKALRNRKRDKKAIMARKKRLLEREKERNEKLKDLGIEYSFEGYGKKKRKKRK